MSNEIMSNVDEQVPLEDYILKYASQIPVRVQIDGKWENRYLDQLPVKDALHQVFQWLRQGTIPHRVTHRE